MSYLVNKPGIFSRSEISQSTSQGFHKNKRLIFAQNLRKISASAEVQIIKFWVKSSEQNSRKCCTFSKVHFASRLFTGSCLLVEVPWQINAYLNLSYTLFRCFLVLTFWYTLKEFTGKLDLLFF